MHDLMQAIASKLAEAVRFRKAGRLDEASALCRQALELDPHHADSLDLLGRISCQSGRLDTAVEMIAKAIAVNAADASYHFHLGNALSAQGRLEDAAASYETALVLKPDYVAAHNNLGNALFDQGKTDQAIASYRRALILRPGLAEAHNNLGTALLEQGKADEAEACFRHTLALAPDFAGARVNLGLALFDKGHMEDAIGCYHEAIALEPTNADAFGYLGIALWDQGKLDAAEASFRRCLQIRPSTIAARINLAALAKARGDLGTALGLVERSLEAEDIPAAQKLFAEIIEQWWQPPDTREIRAAFVRALGEAWLPPARLAKAAALFLKRDPRIGASVARATRAWPASLSAADLFDQNGLAALGQDPLLTALLCSTANADIAMERFLTLARRLMLEAAATTSANEQALNFNSALTRQCFINEYVFFQSDGEIEMAGRLREALVQALSSGTAVPVPMLLAVAAYFPLHAIPNAARLLKRRWPAPVMAVLIEQISQPEEEEALCAEIPRLTPIKDEVSRRVQQQYEENPYPRWIKLPLAEKPTHILVHLARKFPLAVFRRRDDDGPTDILIAGCGTGQQSIATARAFTGARVLAIDLSLSSLAYASRKAREMSLDAIIHAQADILELGGLGRRFDLIECAGVLHHMTDPFAGWRALTSLLRPGGFMKLGFYSEVARRDIVKARGIIAEGTGSATASQIRQARQELMTRSKEFSSVTGTTDFFSTSMCRDLLFHVQEHRMRLADIGIFLKENGFSFLGFELPNHDAVLAAYRRRFAEDPAAVNLSHWQDFETENPALFVGMYVFWVQKAD